MNQDSVEFKWLRFIASHWCLAQSKRSDANTLTPRAFYTHTTWIMISRADVIKTHCIIIITHCALCNWHSFVFHWLHDEIIHVSTRPRFNDIAAWPAIASHDIDGCIFLYRIVAVNKCIAIYFSPIAPILVGSKFVCCCRCKGLNFSLQSNVCFDIVLIDTECWS